MTMGWDDGPELPRETTHTGTGHRTAGRRGLLLAFVAVDVIIAIAVVVFFALR